MKDQLVQFLPDSYAKPVRFREAETATNTWRLFSLSEQQHDAFADKLSDVFHSLDLERSSGDALLMIGELYGISRAAGETEEAYRLRIRAKIAGYFTDGTTDSVLQAVSSVLGVEIGTIYFIETAPATVQMHVKSPEVLQEFSITPNRLRSIIKELLAVGISLEDEIIVGGTFRFCHAGDEKNPDMDGTGYNEKLAGFGRALKMEGMQ